MSKIRKRAHARRLASSQLGGDRAPWEVAGEATQATLLPRPGAGARRRGDKGDAPQPSARAALATLESAGGQYPRTGVARQYGRKARAHRPARAGETFG
jgi:hypothetical protein